MKFLIVTILLTLIFNVFANTYLTAEQQSKLANIAQSIREKKNIEQSPECDFAPHYPLDNFNFTECTADYSEMLVFVTGISSWNGQGRAIALKFAELGASVAGCSRTNKNQVVNMTELTNAGIAYYKCDVGSLQDMINVAGKIKNDYNGQKVTVLVSNAGIQYLGRNIEALRSVSSNNHNDNKDILTYLTAVNQYGLLHTVIAFENEGLIPHDGSGKIFSTASVIAEFAYPWFNIYQDTKKAVAGSALALQLDYGIPNNVTFIIVQPTAMATGIVVNSMLPKNSICPGQLDDMYNFLLTAPIPASDPSYTGEAVAQVACEAGPTDIQKIIIAATDTQYQNNYVNLKTLWCSLPENEAAAIFNSLFNGTPLSINAACY